MKIAITALSDKIDTPFSPKFGRAGYFILIESTTRAWEAFPNPAVNTRGGAGSQAVQFIADKEVEVVISGRYGPTAFDALEAAGIQALIARQGTVREVFEQHMAGELVSPRASPRPKLHDRGRRQS